ncbi:MAG: hypothetical protein IKB05_00805 [Alphaproteobacteria bacterium]|nr:hypothetical protein [Alphaproteobacteria bacterium]
MSENIAQDFARTFCTPSGARVIEHLRKITIERVLGANATDAELRGVEAQRALVHQIENMIERGK